MTFKKAFYWSLFALWFIVVIFLSCQTGSESGGLSQWLATHIFKSTNAEFEHYLRSFSHFGIHFILAILMYVAAYNSDDDPRTFATIIGTLIAICDELIQFYIPGRCPELTDGMLNVTGILIGTLLSAIIAPRKNRPMY